MVATETRPETVLPGSNRRVRVVAITMAATLVLALLMGAWLRGVPTSAEAGFWQTAVQAAFLGVYAVAAALAWWRQIAGATLLAVAAFAIGILSAVQYRPVEGFLLTALLWTPAAMLWWEWQKDRPHEHVAAWAGVLVLVLAGGGAGSWGVWTTFNVHTVQSGVRLPNATAVRWVWSGGVTPTSSAVVTRLVDEDAVPRLLVSPDSDLTGDIERLAPVSTDSTTGVSRFVVSDLRPGTTYFYGVEADGVLDLTRLGRFGTPEQGPHSFRVALASCARTGSNAAVFDTMREQAPDLFLQMGDAFYGNIARNDTGEYLRDYTSSLSRDAQGAFYRSTPMAYMWDDHDFGRNNADRMSSSRPAAMEAYRELVPSYELALPGDETPIAQAFTIGRVRFILTDVRSTADPVRQPDGPDKSTLGEEQRAWFERELLAAADRYPLIVWVSTFPWISSDPTADNWGAYATERREIADFIADHDIRGLVVVSGDAHMLAADDGTHSDYSTDGGAGFPVLQAAALDSKPSVKGGPYSEGAFPGAGQFGLLDVTDDGSDEVSVLFRGLRWNGSEVLRYGLTVPASSR